MAGLPISVADGAATMEDEAETSKWGARLPSGFVGCIGLPLDGEIGPTTRAFSGKVDVVRVTAILRSTREMFRLSVSTGYNGLTRYTISEFGYSGNQPGADKNGRRAIKLPDSGVDSSLSAPAICPTGNVCQFSEPHRRQDRDRQAQEIRNQN
jgi:hypothetical protein